MFSGEAASAASAIATGLATLTIYGVVKCEKLYEEHKTEKNKKEMQKINDFHDKTLANMTAKDHLVFTQISTPAIFLFEKDKDGKELPAKSLYINSAMFLDLYEKIPICNDAQLLLYSHHIQSAMIQLREFFDARLRERNTLFRGDEGDITSSVIYYIILMLSTHCYRVEGNALTLTYLKGLMHFINCFASDHSEKSNRFEYLGFVNAYLATAYEELLQHSLMFSYKETLDALCPEIMGVAIKKIRCAIQMITPFDDWSHLNSMTLDKVVKGLIKEAVVHTKALNPLVGASIPIADSFFKEWIIAVAEDLLLAIKINDNPDDKGAFITRDRLILKEEYSKEEMKKIKKIFEKCDNFFTLKVRPKNEKTLEWVEKYKIPLTNRIHFFFRFMREIKASVDILYDCAHLSNRNKQFGEVYMANPHHCIFVFEVLKGMGDWVKAESTALESRLAKFAVENGTTKMQLYDKTQVFTDLETYLRRGRDLTGNIDYMYKKHQEQPKLRKNKKVSDSLKANSVILLISQRMALTYNIKTTVRVSPDSPTPVLRGDKYADELMGYTPDLVTRTLLPTLAIMPPGKKVPGDETVSPIVTLPDSPGNAVVAVPPMTPKKEALAPAKAAALPPSTSTHNLMTIASLPQVNPISTTPPPAEKVDLRELLLNIKSQIRTIKEQEADSVLASLLYAEAFEALIKLYNKSLKMKKESDSVRRVKGEKIQAYTLKLSTPFFLFLKLPSETRKNRSADFARVCKDIITNYDNDFLDWPKIPCSTIFFKTDSRKNALAFEEKVEAIAARP